MLGHKWSRRLRLKLSTVCLFTMSTASLYQSGIVLGKKEFVEVLVDVGMCLNMKLWFVLTLSLMKLDGLSAWPQVPG